MPAEVKRKRIGLLGGTFDPVHNGHLAVANHVLHTLNLDSILFIPAALPPHKDGHADGLNISSFADRLVMLERAVADYSSFVVSDIEAKRLEPSYSIDTINILNCQLGNQADLFFIIGVDAFLEIDTWKRYKDLPGLVNFVVISRPTYSPEKVGDVIRHNFPDFTFDPAAETWISLNSRGSFIIQHMEPVPISSTEIRENVKDGKDITGLVPAGVGEYILKHRLYLEKGLI